MVIPRIDLIDRRHCLISFPIRVSTVISRSCRFKDFRTLIIRSLSSRGSNNGKNFQLDAVPFSVSPDEAYKQFESWAINKQGLGPFLNVGGSIGSASISAAFAPFWYFSLNVRFVAPPSKISGIYDWRPDPFLQAYSKAPDGVIHIPGLAAYAGFSYRRSLMDPVHNTTLVFKNDSIVPFGSWMLNPLKFRGTGSAKETHELEIYPDPWNATRERAFTVIYDELYEMSNEQFRKKYPLANEAAEVKVEVERLSSRRIYMPTYIVEYTILGVSYRAFLSGCDPSIEVSGLSHKSMFNTGSKGDKVFQGATSFLSHKIAPIAATALQFFGLRPFAAIAQAILGLVSRLAMRFHIIGVLGGGAVLAWRKLVRPYIDDRAASAEWERQRDHEAQFYESHVSYTEFHDGGKAQSYFVRNQQQILRHLSGQEGRQHQTENQEWYTQWEEWAKQQWENAQREASREQQEWQRRYQEQSSAYHQQRRSTNDQERRFRKKHEKYQQAKREEVKWDFDVNDPYSILGIPRSASKDEVSKAFRREMLKYHPDTMAGASESNKRIATERSKLISDAYRKIKAGQKRSL